MHTSAKKSCVSISQRVYVLVIEILWKVFLLWMILIIQLRRRWAFVACKILWPDLIIIFHVRATRILERFELWAYKHFVKQDSDVDILRMIWQQSWSNSFPQDLSSARHTCIIFSPLQCLHSGWYKLTATIIIKLQVWLNINHGFIGQRITHTLLITTKLWIML